MQAKSVTILAFLACLLSQAAGSGIFELNFASLVDSFGRDLREDCCAWQNQIHRSQQPECDPKKCQLIIRMCVKNYQTQIIDSSQCTFGELTAQVSPSKSNENSHELQYPRNQQAKRSQPTSQQLLANQARINIHHQRIMQQQQQSLNARYLPQPVLSSGQPRALRQIAFQHPISFPFNFTWPGSFSLVIDAWFESPTGLQQVVLPFAPELQRTPTTTYDLYKKQLIIKYSTRGWLSVKNEWTSDVHKTDLATLAYSYRVTCQPNYYGEQCNILCRPRDDIYGHYTCSQQGSIVCLPGWQGSYCLDPICSPGCHKDQGNCSRPNECNCRFGWQGSSCEQCITYPGCVHGYCNRPHECICEEGWGGLLCNEDLNFCSNHQPCKNGGLCTTDPNGLGSYACTCAPGFTGKNCERRSTQLQQQQQHYQHQQTTNQTRSNADIHLSSSNNPISQNSDQPANSKSKSPKQANIQASQLTSANVVPFIDLHHYSQPIIQPQQTIDHWVLVAYITIIVCMVILVVLLLLRIFFDRTTQRQWTQDSSHVEDVATLQNHQNIYKSRTSLSTEKTPYDTIDRGSSTSGNGDQTYPGSARLHTRQLNHSYHNLQALGALNPPPPYTMSQSHPSSAYNSTYGASIYTDPSTTNRTNSSGASTATNSTNAYLYTSSASLNPYGRTGAVGSSSNSANPYGSTGSTTYQSPCYVIAYHIQS